MGKEGTARPTDAGGRALPEVPGSALPERDLAAAASSSGLPSTSEAGVERQEEQTEPAKLDFGCRPAPGAYVQSNSERGELHRQLVCQLRLSPGAERRRRPPRQCLLA